MYAVLLLIHVIAELSVQGMWFKHRLVAPVPINSCNIWRNWIVNYFLALCYMYTQLMINQSNTMKSTIWTPQCQWNSLVVSNFTSGIQVKCLPINVYRVSKWVLDNCCYVEGFDYRHNRWVTCNTSSKGYACHKMKEWQTSFVLTRSPFINTMTNNSTCSY